MTDSPARIGAGAASTTRMAAEAGEAAERVATQLAANAEGMARLAARLRGAAPRIVFTCARGSSDHAATFAKYLFELRLGIPTLSHAPSIASVYGRPLLHMRGQPFILVSQSGRSPDLLASAEAAAAAGALVIALVNDTASPLAGLAEIVIPLLAGPETSIAATKSYLATLTALAQLVSCWEQDAALARAVATLPEALDMAWRQDWSAGVELFAHVRNLFVLGRGLTLGIALEAALKFKETCGIHGEAFSIAEVAHGPIALASPDFPALIFPPHGEAVAGLADVAAAFAARGAPVLAVGDALPGQDGLPIASDLHPVIAPIAMAQSFYRMVDALARRRGLDPDHPPLLRKVTETR